jgi:hypothetical protein
MDVRFSIHLHLFIKQVQIIVSDNDFDKDENHLDSHFSGDNLKGL